jgi:hypothetical protein
MLREILPKTGKRFSFKYEYDFGDGWEHEVVFEGCLQTDLKAKYPICVEVSVPATRSTRNTRA